MNRTRLVLAVLAASALLAGCPATTGAVVAAVVKPSGFGVRNDARFGRCFSAGAAIAGQAEVTVHLCAHWLDGAALTEIDASAPAPASGSAQ